ncbi:MAG: BspA family leucine-rich repeat surface protein [Clostridia bacterium]
MRNIKKNSTNGITLIALVITIIVLLILAGVNIAILTEENGLLTKSRDAKIKTEISTEQEQIQLALIAYKMDSSNNDKYTLIEKETNQKILNKTEENILKGEIIELENGRKYLITDNSVEYIDGIENAIILRGGTDNSSFLEGSNTYLRKDVEIIEIVNNKNISKDAIDSWDISENKDGSVVAWITDEDNNNLYEWYIGANYRIKANTSMTWYFRSFTNLKSISGLEYMDFSQTTSISAMFEHDNSLKELNLDSLDTKNVRNLSSLLSSCYNLESISMKNIDISNVKSLKELFMNCKNIKYICLSNWQTEHITNMDYMFYGCNNLEEVDLSSFTINASVKHMFYGCNTNIKILVKNEETKNKILESGFISESNIELKKN